MDSIKDREFNDARSFVSRGIVRASRKIFSASIEQRSAYTSRSHADDKEKCCLESRSWLNLGHPDDGACTFSTILLFLLSALPRVRSRRAFDGTTPFLSSLLFSLALSFDFDIQSFIKPKLYKSHLNFAH